MRQSAHRSRNSICRQSVDQRRQRQNPLPPGLTVSEPQKFNRPPLPIAQQNPQNAQQSPPSNQKQPQQPNVPPAELLNQDPFASLPPNLETTLSDVTVPLSATETPFFWHIPRSGGTLIKTLLGTCLQKVVASEFGALDGHDTDTVSSL